jgi:hypothetical protein
MRRAAGNADQRDTVAANVVGEFCLIGGVESGHSRHLDIGGNSLTAGFPQP